MSTSGGCRCGAIRFEAEGVSKEVHACHCSMCVGWSGGPGMGVNVASITFEDEAPLGRFDSSPWAERGFCTRCGTNLFYRLKEPNHYTVWLGSFDDPKPFELTMEVYVDEKPPSYHFAGHHARLTGEQFLATLAPPSE